MKTLINILCVTLAITFVSVGVQASPVSGLSKILKMVKILKPLIPNPFNSPQYIKIYKHIRINTSSPQMCEAHNKKINDKEYQRSIFEKLSEQDEENEKFLSSEKVTKINKQFKYIINCSWEEEACICFSRKAPSSTIKRLKVEPIKMKPQAYKQLQDNLLLFYTGTTRSASEVLNDQKHNLVNENEKFDSMVCMTELVEKAKNNLCESDLEGFGKILYENWKLKRSLSNKISNTKIDDICSLAIKNGALGGKLLGAGGGGFLLFYCEQEYQENLTYALHDLRELDFRFERGGSKLIYVGDIQKEDL